MPSRVVGGTERLTRHLTESGVAWEMVDPNLRVNLADPKEVLRHVRAAGVTIRHLAPVTLSLEEAFEQALAAGGKTDA